MRLGQWIRLFAIAERLDWIWWYQAKIWCQALAWTLLVCVQWVWSGPWTHGSCRASRLHHTARAILRLIWRSPCRHTSRLAGPSLCSSGAGEERAIRVHVLSTFLFLKYLATSPLPHTFSSFLPSLSTTPDYHPNALSTRIDHVFPREAQQCA